MRASPTIAPFARNRFLQLLLAAYGALWIALLLSVLLSADRIFQQDYDDGSLDMVVAIFVNSYIVIVVWILLQVSVAVLLVRARASQRGLALCGLDCDSVTLLEPARLFPVADVCWFRPTPAPLQGQFFHISSIHSVARLLSCSAPQSPHLGSLFYAGDSPEDTANEHVVIV